MSVDLHDLGTFNSLAEVWAAYPDGGHEGDYVTIAGEKIYWNKYLRRWGNPSSETEQLISSGTIYVGTTLKVALTPMAEGFDPESNNWTVDVYYGDGDNAPIHYDKSDLVQGDGVFYLIIDTAELSGDIRAVIKADISDPDCDDSIRHEVAVVNICRLINP